MIRAIHELVLPTDVDLALPHEHVLHTIGAHVAARASCKDLEIRPEDLIVYRHAPFAKNGRNLLLQKEDEVFREVARLERITSTRQRVLLLDVTLPVEGRDGCVKERLRLAARLQDVHLLTVTTFESARMKDVAANGVTPNEQSEQIAAILETELMFGIQYQDVVAYPGAMYQQIEVERNEMSAHEQVLVHGLAMAQARTHAPLYLSFSSTDHLATCDFKHVIHNWIRLLIKAGAERKKLVLCHADRWCQGDFQGADHAFLLELLDCGISILFDAIGLFAVCEVWPINYCLASTLDSGESFDFKAQPPPTDACLANWIATLVKAKPHYSLQILLSTNVHQRIQYRRYGGGGYTYLFEQFKARLLHQGVSIDQWKQIVCQNVVDLLAWYVPPVAAPLPKEYLQCSVCTNSFEPIEGEYFTKFTFTYCGIKCLRHHSRLKFKPLAL